MSAVLGRAPVREPDTPVSAPSLTLHRTLSIVAAVGLFYPLLKAWNVVIADPAVGIATVALVAGTLWMICALATAEDEAALERLDRWLLVLALLTVAAWGAQTLWQTARIRHRRGRIHARRGQPAHARSRPLWRQPHRLAESVRRPARILDLHDERGMVSTLGYPALPVLLTAPFVLLAGGGQAVQFADLTLLAVAVIGLFLALPKPWRGMAVIVGIAFPVLFGLASAGDNAVMMMVPLLLVAFRWQSVGASGRLARIDVVRAIALGLAISCNQLAWFVAPFVVVGIFMTRRGDLGGIRAFQLAARFAGLALATFVLINLPFIVWGPAAWVSGVLAPLTQHALPYGQGLVGLSVFLRLGGGDITAYTYAAALLYLALLALFVIDFGRLARCCFVLPSVALFVSGRSLSVYWTALVAVVVVSVATGGRGPGTSPPAGAWPRWRGRALPHALVFSALFAPVVACLALALGAPAPLRMQILSARSDPASRSVTQLRLAVSNRSGSTLQPHFSADTKGYATAFWRIVSGPRECRRGPAPRMCSRPLMLPRSLRMRLRS